MRLTREEKTVIVMALLLERQRLIDRGSEKTEVTWQRVTLTESLIRRLQDEPGDDA